MTFGSGSEQPGNEAVAQLAERRTEYARCRFESCPPLTDDSEGIPQFHTPHPALWICRRRRGEGAFWRTAVNAIYGTPEGRDGIWLIDSDIAAELISSAGERVHNFIGGGGPVMIGCDWDAPDAIELCQRDGMRLALLFPPNDTMRHQLICCSDAERWSFDIGEIDESRMTERKEDE